MAVVFYVEHYAVSLREMPAFEALAIPRVFRPQEIWCSHTLGQGVHKLSADLAGYPALSLLA